MGYKSIRWAPRTSLCLKLSNVLVDLRDDEVGYSQAVLVGVSGQKPEVAFPFLDP